MAKTGTQDFTSSWHKTIAWAQNAGIPKSSYYPVYQQDAQRMVTSGSSMSASERIRAIQAANGENYSSALPTDAHNPANVIGNIKTNAANIFTGLNPVSLVKNIFDTVTNTLEHPSSFLDLLTKGVPDLFTNPAALPSLLEQTVLAPHSLLSWVPGLADVAELAQGKSGIDNLLTNPLTSLLDLMPMQNGISHILGMTAEDGAARFAAGQSVADKLGVNPSELSKMSAQSIAWKLTRELKSPLDRQRITANQVTGEISPRTLGQRFDALRNAGIMGQGIGHDQSELSGGMIALEQKGTEQVKALVQPAIKAISDLSTKDFNTLNHVAQTDFRPASVITNDFNIPEPVRTALSHVFDVIHTLEQMKMQAGEIRPIRTIVLDDKGNEVHLVENYLVTPGSAGAKVNAALSRSDRAQAAADAGSKNVDRITDEIAQNDAQLSPFITTAHVVSQQVYNSIKVSISDLPDSAAERARASLSDDERRKLAEDELHQGLTGKRLHPVPKDTVVLHNLLGLGPDDKISLHSMNAIRDLFSPGGLMDSIYKAYDDHDFVAMAKFSGLAKRKFANKVFDKIPNGPNGHLQQMKNVVTAVDIYATKRAKLVDEAERIWTGAKKGVKPTKAQIRKSARWLNEEAQRAHQDFIKTSIANPPDVWDSAFLQAKTDAISKSLEGAAVLKDFMSSLRNQNPDEWSDTEYDKILADPQTMVELVQRVSKDTYSNPMLPDFPIKLWHEMSDNAYQELSHLRAQGMVPHYIPKLPANEVDRAATYNLHLQALQPKHESALSARIFDYKPYTFDIQLGLLKGAKEALHDHILTEFHDTYVTKLLYDGPALRQNLMQYLKSDYAVNALRNRAGEGFQSADAIMQKAIEDMGLVNWNPDKMFGNLSTPKLQTDHYINKDIAAAMEKQVQSLTQAGHGFYDRGTKVFRYSILGLSPRFTAHILFGGTYLVGLRGHAGMLPFFGEAIRHARTGAWSPDIIEQFPHLDTAFGKASTQEGTEDLRFHAIERRATDEWHKAGGRQMGTAMVKELYDKVSATSAEFKGSGAIGWLKAASDINFRFTRAITMAQKSVTYLDGAARAAKDGHFYEDQYTPRVDVNGNQVINPITGKQVFDHSRVKVDMTPEQAHVEGMEAVAKTMGDLRNMTPLERNVLLKVMPFYGWTKHILTYVMSYPEDHPYRAMFLSQLATQNSNDVASGLPTRIQLLFFLGKPDASGNVSAVDDRFLDPLRDTANYASWTGLFQSLNPIITAPFAAVDPSITFGGTPLYPNVSYNALYGTKTSGAQGAGFWGAAEGIVPQIGALDAAFNLSGQYNYLKTSSPGGFVKKVAESLNVPFADVQHLNLRQIAAEDEITRYQIAANDAYQAVSTGDFSTLDKYPPGATVPDPMGTTYNVTPAYLKALYDETEKRFGLPPTQALPSLPAAPLK